MSSLVSLKKDIEQITQDLHKEVTEQVEIEGLLATQTFKVEVLKKHLKKLQRALDILEGTDLSEPTGNSDESPVSVPPSPSPSPAAPTKPAYTGPICSACEGRMIPVVTRAPSGVLIQHLKCEDCSNEAF